jgi:hypothetical protein
MATLTKITKFRRKLRRAKAGKDRKAQLASKGSTPAFPLHTPDIDAAAPPAQVSPKTNS